MTNQPTEKVAPRRGVMGLFTRFRKNSRGTVAVEFSMVAMPFILMLTMIFDVSLAYFARKTLDLAVDKVSRQIRTGELTVAVPADPNDPDQQAEVEQAALELFTTRLCEENYMQILFKCSAGSSKFKIDVQTVASWADAPSDAEQNETLEVDGDGNESVTESVNDDDFGFKPGGRLSINVVRVFYEWESLVPIKIVQSADDNWIGRNRLLASSSAFMTEPF